ncbi:MAG: RNA polymerase sigma factor [Pirellulaceae bacterium]
MMAFTPLFGNRCRSTNVQNDRDVDECPSIETDESLIRMTLAGEASAFDRLVHRHAPRLLTMIRGQVRDPEDAEDLMQETLAQAYFKLDTFAGKSSFFTWLYRIAFNRNITKRRKRRLETTHDRIALDQTSPPEDSAPPIDQSMTEHENAEALWQAINHLDAERRTVLVLRDMQGLDYHEIAELLSIPKGTVRSRLHRARIELRETLIRKGFIDRSTSRGQK